MRKGVMDINLKSIDAYQLKSLLIIFPRTKNKDYVSVLEQTPEKIDNSSDPADMGRIVLVAISRCRLADHQPNRADALATELGMKDWKDFTKKSIMCSAGEIENDPLHLLIHPWAKKRGHFEACGDGFKVERTNIKEIGERVKEALALYQPLTYKKKKETLS